LLDQLLEDRNLNVTVDILVRTLDIRRELLRRFTDAMVARLREESNDSTWTAELRGRSASVPDLSAPWSRLYFFKPAWRGLFAIGFSNEGTDAMNMIFGIFYWDREIGKAVNRRVADGKLSTLLAQSFGSGKGSDHWDWFQYLAKLDMARYANWYDEDVTRKMAQNGGERMVSELFPILKRAVDIAEKYLDQEGVAPG
jgi:hypothetical protein